MPDFLTALYCNAAIRLRRVDYPRCVGALVLAVATPLAHASADCWDAAARPYGIDPTLLLTIAQLESGLNDTALHRNADGSDDIGVMQINSHWLPTLRRYGIDRKALYQPCTNERVGAWILADAIGRYGSTWRAIGSYNARTPAKQLAYAEKIYYRYHRPRRTTTDTHDTVHVTTVTLSQ
jgi:soluble lytic murein transglycosylase-like protein